MADVVVVARGKQGGKRFRSLYQGTFFIEKQGKAWTVIGFDVDQRRLPREWRRVVNPQIRPYADPEKGKAPKKGAKPAAGKKPAKGGKG